MSRRGRSLTRTITKSASQSERNLMTFVLSPRFCHVLLWDPELILQVTSASKLATEFNLEARSFFLFCYIFKVILKWSAGAIRAAGDTGASMAAGVRETNEGRKPLFSRITQHREMRSGMGTLHPAVSRAHYTAAEKKLYQLPYVPRKYEDLYFPLLYYNLWFTSRYFFKMCYLVTH